MEHLVRLVECVQPSDWASGMVWYRLANEHARRIAGFAGVTLRQASAVIAVLSPRAHWSENLRVAHLVAQHYALGGSAETFNTHTRITRVNVSKAFRILAGDLAALHGPKTTAFADNIQFPQSSSAVTVDGWAYRCWAGLIGVTDEFKVRLDRGDLYDRVADDYRSLACDMGLLGLELQAVVWVAAHRIENRPL